MRFIVAICLFFTCLTSRAELLLRSSIYSGNVYASATGSDSNSGLSSGSPVQTLAKLQTLITASTTINLHKGDTFFGTLSVPASCVLQGYGSGVNPIISGFDALSWSSLGGNLYKATDTNLGGTVNVVTIGGVQQAVARFPKSGYRTYTSHSGTLSITDATLPNSPSYADGSVYIRVNRFTGYTGKITSQSGGVIAYSGGTLQPTNNFGYILLNSLSAVTQQNDWSYDGAGHVTMYSTSTPTSVRSSRFATLLTITGNSVVVNGVDFEGANTQAILANNRNSLVLEHFAIRNCQLGININNGNTCDIDDLTIDHINDIGIYLPTSNSNSVTSCTISNCGMIPGSGVQYRGIYVASNSGSSNNTFTDNTIHDTGGDGVYLSGEGFTFTHNHVYNCLSIIDDGGCVYYDNGQGTPHNYVIPRTVSNNVIHDAIGAQAGTNGNNLQAVGIYNDDQTNNVVISGNTVYNCTRFGIFLHNAYNITVSGNTVKNGGTAQIGMIHDGLVPTKLSAIILSNNQLVAQSGQKIIWLASQNSNSLASDFTTWGTATNNKYGSEYNNSSPFTTQFFGASSVTRTLSNWKAFTTTDANATHQNSITVATLFPVNPPSTTQTLVDNYVDLTGASYPHGTITIPAYGSKYLIFSSTYVPPIPPIPTPGTVPHGGYRVLRTGNFVRYN